MSNSEYKTQFETFGKVIVVILFALLYSLGGIEYKWLRRYCAPILLQVFVFVYTRDPKYLIQFPFQVLSLSLGYGADATSLKLMRRAIFGLANTVTFFPMIRKWGSSAVILLATFAAMVIGGHIVFGVFNPWPNARTEEFVLGLFIALTPVMSAKKREEQYV